MERFAVRAYNGLLRRPNGQAIILPEPPPYAAESFVMKVDTTKAGSASDTFVLPCIFGGYNITIKWGDGSESTHTSSPGNITKVYAASGEYIIEVLRNTPTGFPRLRFNNAGDKLKLMEVLQVGEGQWQEMALSFFGCSNMVWSATDAPDWAGATPSLVNVFTNCSLFNGDIRNWDVSKVTNLESAFQGTIINRDLSSWDVGNCTNMARMFQSLVNFNHNLSSWNTSKVTNILAMLAGATAYKQPIMFDYRAVTTANDFCNGVNINTTGSTANYDATLEHIRKHLDTVFSGESAVRGLQSGVTIHFGSYKFSAAGQASKAAIVAAKSWNFTDGGLA